MRREKTLQRRSLTSQSESLVGTRGIVMKAILASLLLFFGFQWTAAAQVNFGLSISDGRVRDFYMAVGDYYHVAPQVVVEVHDRYRVPDDELPVVYFLAGRARVEPAAIINLRVRKMSWFDIAFHYHLSPEIFFVPVTVERIGPPYGHAYGYYRKHGRSGDWRDARLSDREVVDLVNLRFMSDYYRMPPEDVIRLRGQHSQFVVINDEIRKEKTKGKPAKSDRDSKGRGNGKKKR